MPDRQTPEQSEPPAARSPRRRALVVGLAWLGAVLISGTVAWNAVAVISDDSARTGVLSADQVADALASARSDPTTGPASDPSRSPTATPTPTPSATEPAPTTSAPTRSPSTSPSSTAPATPVETRTWQVTGGTVTAQCVGSAIALVSATPSDGWTVKTDSTGPEQVEVELRRSDHETHLVASCQGGVPVSATGQDEDHESGESHED